MIFFKNTLLELFKYNEVEEYDVYGEPLKEYVYSDTVYCDMQPLSMNESIESFGEIKTDTFKIYFDENIQLLDSMVFRVKDETDTYEIIGGIEKYKTIIPHQVVTVQKQRKPCKELRL